MVARSTIAFDTQAGSLTAHRTGELIEMDFPAEMSTDAEMAAALARAIGQAPRRVERNRLNYLVELDSALAVRDLRLDLMALRDVDRRGVIVTARATADADFASRFFRAAIRPRRGRGDWLGSLLPGSVLAAPARASATDWTPALAARRRRARAGGGWRSCARRRSSRDRLMRRA